MSCKLKMLVKLLHWFLCIHFWLKKVWLCGKLQYFRPVWTIPCEFVDSSLICPPYCLHHHDECLRGFWLVNIPHWPRNCIVDKFCIVICYCPCKTYKQVGVKFNINEFVTPLNNEKIRHLRKVSAANARAPCWSERWLVDDPPGSHRKSRLTTFSLHSWDVNWSRLQN